MNAEPQTLSNPQNFVKEEENRNQTLIQRQNDQDQRQSEVKDEDHTLMQHPTAGLDNIYGLDGDDLIFSDDAFASFPDFRCLSSPSSSPSRNSATHPLKCVPTATSTTSSSSSSSCSTFSNWPFLCTSDAVPGSLPASSSEMSMQPQPSNPDPSAEAETTQPDIDLLDAGVDAFDFSVPWDSAEILPLTLDESGACSDPTFNLDQLCPRFDEMNNNSGAVGGEDKEESDDLANFFLEWLKNNKDAISPEDLRSIRLKKSTVESAACRLGSDRHGRMQLVKLILSWVQNHHLQRKKGRLQESGQSHATTWYNPAPAFNPAPFDSVPNYNPKLNSDFDVGQATNGCNSWQKTTDPYSFQQSCTNNSAVTNSQLYTSVSELHATDPSMSWDQSYNPPFRGYPMTYQAGLQTTQYSAALIGPMYHQGQSISSMATKEARRKRMARQRRMLSLQQSRGLGLNDDPEQCGFIVGQGNDGGRTRNWECFSSMAINRPHRKGMMDLNLLPGGSSSTLQTMHGSGQYERGILRPGGSSSGRRQGLKSYDKNLRFLLQKVLKQSDVGGLGRIVLPKKEAEIHLPELDSRDGITIPMEDIATSRVWNMRYRFWPNNKSRMYLLENTGDFVRSNGLEEGDFIVIYSDAKSGKYMIRGVKVKQSQEKERAKVEEKHVHVKSNKRNTEESTSSSLHLSEVQKC